MSSPISPISPIRLPESLQGPIQTGANGAFKSILDSAIGAVQANQAQLNANDSVQKFLSGDSEELHSTALAVQRAELEFDLFMQVRNKVVQAYQEIMRMQL